MALELHSQAVQAPVRLAFFLLAHRSAANVQRLLGQIYAPEHVYLVHVDLKSPQAAEFSTLFRFVLF